MLVLETVSVSEGSTEACVFFVVPTFNIALVADEPLLSNKFLTVCSLSSGCRKTYSFMQPRDPSLCPPVLGSNVGSVGMSASRAPINQSADFVDLLGFGCFMD